MPVRCLKYLPKKDCDTKFRRSDPSCMLKPDCVSNSLALLTTAPSITFEAFLPTFFLHIKDRYFGVIPSCLA